MRNHALAPRASRPRRSGQPEQGRDVRATFVSADLEVIGAAFATDKEIAQTLGVDPAQLSRWRRGQLPDAENQTKIRMLADAVRELCTRYEPEVVPGWLRAPSLGEGESPAGLLRKHRYDDLFAEIRESVQDAYS